MPLQNRVDPWGNLKAVSAKGALLGNRGILHDDTQQIVKAYQHQSWVMCKLKYKDRKRTIMTKNRYTELFFLDEATAFAAGHRPCGECSRERYIEFKAYWINANFKEPPLNINAVNINKMLHKDRICNKVKVTFKARLKDLPDGIFFSNENAAYLKHKNKIYRWSFEGYSLSKSACNFDEVDVLTPRSVVNAFRLGFKPVVHDSVNR